MSKTKTKIIRLDIAAKAEDLFDGLKHPLSEIIRQLPYL